jgi:NAD+ kinase
MNPKQNYNLPDVISHSHGIKVPALEMTSPNQSKKIYAFNEVSLLRQTRQIAHLRVIIDGVERLSNYRGDGILLSTPMGSTAYNSSCGGPILPINSQVLALTPLSPFKPRHMKSAILGNSSVVQIINEDAPKRPVSATADSTEVRDIENITIRLSNISRTLLFDPDYNLAEKIISEQFEY